MLLSGPAGGVTGAVWVAEQCGYRDLITFDMGGTSTDVALVQDLTPRIGRETKVGDLTVRASSVDVRTVGAGGGSIAHVPELTRALRVGPQSAGADPGPAAYGKGGIEPTVTDANVVLGYLPSSLAGGEITLDVDAARAAVQKVAEAMGLERRRRPPPASSTSSTRTCSAACGWSRVQQGFDPRDFALVAFGGAGPLHANALGKLTGAWPVIVPPSPGVLCALGDATTGRGTSPPAPCCAGSPTSAAASWPTILRELADDAGQRLADAGPAARRSRRSRYQVDVRYHRPGLRDPGRRRPVAGWTTPDGAFGRLGETLRRRARAAVLLPARRRPRAGQRPRHGHRPEARRRAGAAGGRRRRPGRGAGTEHPIYVDGELRRRARVYDRARAAGRRRDRRSRDRRRDGLHDPGAARARRHRAPVGQPADPPRRED